MQVKPVIAAHDFDLHVVNYSARNKLCSSLSHELPMWGQYIEALYDTKKHSQASKTGRKKKRKRVRAVLFETGPNSRRNESLRRPGFSFSTSLISSKQVLSKKHGHIGECLVSPAWLDGQWGAARGFRKRGLRSRRSTPPHRHLPISRFLWAQLC